MVKPVARATTPTLAAGNKLAFAGHVLTHFIRCPQGGRSSMLPNLPHSRQQRFTVGGLPPKTCRQLGFTLIELLVVMALVAIGSSLVVLNLRDAPQQKLNQEADRLVAVLENAKAQARSRSTPMVWRSDAQGFTLRSLPLQGPPLQTMTWLHPGTQVQPAEWVISAEPVQAAMQFQLMLNGGSLLLKSDGVQAFKVQP
jgi:general secretion pathway protein H